MTALTRILAIALICACSQSTLAALPLTDSEGRALPTLAPMLKRVNPAVVNIATFSRQQVNNPLLNDPFFRRFFNLPDPRRQQPQKRQTSAGSGVIVDARDGTVLTNYHVIKGADEVQVSLIDGRAFAAEVLGTDPELDIAVLKIKGEDLAEVPMADSSHLQVGDFSVAIGNPFGLGQTVTTGVISALGRSGLGIEGYENFIQTDASINPGNSGGALVNLRGELIGINTAIYGPSGGNVGIGFAIPMNMAKQISEQLIEHGEVKRGRLGFSAQDLTPELAEAFGITRSKGVVVARVEGDSPADKAGMNVGDVIVSVNGRDVQSSAQVRNEIGLLRIGNSVKIGILRNGKSRTLTATVEDQITETVQGEKLSKLLAGAVFSEERQETARGTTFGIEVISVSGKAASAGLRKGDIIISVNKQRVKTIRGMKTAIQRNADAVLLNIQRDSRGLFLLIQ